MEKKLIHGQDLLEKRVNSSQNSLPHKHTTYQQELANKNKEIEKLIETMKELKKKQQNTRQLNYTSLEITNLFTFQPFPTHSLDESEVCSREKGIGLINYYQNRISLIEDLLFSTFPIQNEYFTNRTIPIDVSRNDLDQSEDFMRITNGVSYTKFLSSTVEKKKKEHRSEDSDIALSEKKGNVDKISLSNISSDLETSGTSSKPIKEKIPVKLKCCVCFEEEEKE